MPPAIPALTPTAEVVPGPGEGASMHSQVRFNQNATVQDMQTRSYKEQESTAFALAERPNQ